MELQKVQLSTYDSERTLTAIGYGIFSLGFCTSLVNTKESKTHSACTSRTIVCRASTLIIADLFISVFIWIYSNLQAKSKKLDRKLLSELLNEMFSLKSRHNKKMCDTFILEHYIYFAESDTPTNNLCEFFLLGITCFIFNPSILLPPGYERSRNDPMLNLHYSLVRI